MVLWLFFQAKSNEDVRLYHKAATHIQINLTPANIKQCIGTEVSIFACIEKEVRKY